MAGLNTKWKLIAEDFNSTFTKNYLWVRSFLKLPQLLGAPIAILGCVNEGDHLIYISDIKNWARAHKIIKKRAEADIHYVEKLIDDNNEFGDEFNLWTEKEIFRRDLSKYSNKQLIALLCEYGERWDVLNVFGLALPTLDFGPFAFIEGNLEKILKTKLKDKDKYAEYYRVFTYPINDSFNQDQETDLFKLILKYQKKKQWIKDVMSFNYAEMVQKYPDFGKDLKKHSIKHGWVYYGFCGPAFSEKDFYGFVKDHIEKKVDASKKLLQIKQEKSLINELKRKYIANLKPNEFEKVILNLAGKLVWAKPRRKDFQTKALFHLDSLLKEVAHRLNISFNQARSASFETLAQGLKGKKVDVGELNENYKYHAIVPDDKGFISILSGEKAKSFFKNKVIKPIISSKKVSIIKGNTAFPGKKRGIVKIVNKPSEMIKMQEGNILVAIATTPQVVPAMKKASAIVTDEGGLTCHASIVSRELKITCVVGTKIATKVFNDGDLVEVDALKGIVTKLKRR